MEEILYFIYLFTEPKLNNFTNCIYFGKYFYQDELEVSGGETLLPLNCRIEARFIRIIVTEADSNDDTKGIGVR